MFRRTLLAAVAALFVGALALEASARNPAYYGTTPGVSARTYSGEYQAMRPNVVPTFSLPAYGGGYYGGGYYGGYRSYYGAGYGGGYYGAYPQPVIVYPPVYYYGF